MSMKVEKQIQTKVTLYMDSGESSTVYFDTRNDGENEATFADAEICKQQLELAVEIVESITNFHQTSNAVYEVFEILAENNVLKEISTEPTWEKISRELSADGKRVAAIQNCRKATGWGLKEAKDYCDDNFWRPNP